MCAPVRPVASAADRERGSEGGVADAYMARDRRRSREYMRNENASADAPGKGLAEHVFSGVERWGWEFVQPPEPPPHAEADRPPVYQEPSHAELRHAQERATEGRSGFGGGCVTLVVAAVAFFSAGVLGLVTVAVIVAVIMSASSPQGKVRAAERRLASRQAQARAAHDANMAAWRARLAAHQDEHRRRNESLDVWFPVALTSRPSRIDVFGGTADGWASLLATVGGPLLNAGRPMVVLDLTEQAVALELAGLAVQHEVAVRHVPMPGTLVRTDLGAGASPEELAETVAEALATIRPPGTDMDLHSVDVDVLRTVAGRLEGRVDLVRLAAGLRVLLRTYDIASDGSGPLSAAEVEAMTQAIDLVGQTERVQNELRYVWSQLELLTRAGQAEPVRSSGTPVADWWQPGALTVVTSEDPIRRRKDLADRLAFFHLLHALPALRLDGTATLVIAGADHLGRDALEAMARQARTTGVRLVLLMEHLREGPAQVAGGSDSATVFMRMGNGEEAKSAAGFIGQEHKFLVNQVTRQVGETLTEGRSDSYTYQRGASDSQGSNSGGGSGGGSWGRSSSFSTSLSRSWQESTNSSLATSTTDGETRSRVYEFAVEPTRLQALPVTGLILVEAGPGGRRVVFGDCNPGINLMPRLSRRPRTVLP
ncbi:hypothetical protein [Streptomyces sp. H51]|uniref:hypothetical protein n=1 Tax=Streptomyces sp. H51 TaxID=3111770 RepID=UPI002D7748B6|nr:hypothetical protein [Streptomyces sp. H51]